MKLLSLLSLLGLALATTEVNEDEQPKLEKLQIGVLKRISKEDCKVKAGPGNYIQVHYTGTLLKDGSKFDSSLDRNKPFEFELGRGMVIKGWDIGLNGMCEGEKRKIKIPSDMAYGVRGSPPKIPANAPLVFEVEMLNIFKDAKAFYAHEESKAKKEKEDKKEAESVEDEDL
ncbi:hypothetical protein CONCODRAFT_85088 [Conidiobolus coronatus NRRL 28638]|uniref:peptidylprolyl isomerase n=1 Tax=Conidiobolus coronatus (strain ATCC 28846 / CBS 209.66 / NRRL 28638) TaxID=796925 RepID=A0A137P6Y5_CONC2|nr:hypothetical protein CONCODRAFT_85088 [Conidiobolus coronatus NRRL 28638]|eukprot:KXN70777.1 hypothetical protein CONCODRAFT_85088 [Conidiobolus coronatus NRRL 28638]